MVLEVAFCDQLTSLTLLDLSVLGVPWVSGYCVWDFAFVVFHKANETSCRSVIANVEWASCYDYGVYHVIYSLGF